MGGYGSGMWYRFGSKRTTAELSAVDVRAWHRQGKLDPQKLAIRLMLVRYGGEIKTLRFDVAADAAEVYMGLVTKMPLGGGLRWATAIEWTPCNYGGARPWFVCPDCGRRAAKLYAARIPFTCRRCVDLAYDTQRESNIEHVTRKFREARVRLGGSPVLTESMSCARPKGMHHRTYHRLLQELLEAAREYREAMEVWGAVATRRIDRITASLERIGTG